MAWQWSHSQEVYDKPNYRIEAMEVDELVEIMLEWLAFHDKRISDEERQIGEPANFRRTAKREAWWRDHCKKFGTEHIAEKIWEYAEQHALCDNGGFDMWVCPYGCHTVPASPECDEE